MLDLSPETESRLLEYAAREGIDPDEALNRLLRSVTPRRLEAVEAADNPMLQLLQKQLREAENATPEEVARADAEWQQFQLNLNETRRTNDERLLFPLAPPRKP